MTEQVSARVSAWLLAVFRGDSTRQKSASFAKNRREPREPVCGAVFDSRRLHKIAMQSRIVASAFADCVTRCVTTH